MPVPFSNPDYGIAMRLQNKVALVTGSSTGIGAAIAKGFAAEGADVVVNYQRDMNGATQTAASIESVGRQALVVQADVGESAAVDCMFAKIRDRFGRLDLLVNNAGISPRRSFVEFTEDEWDRVHHTNLKSVFLCTQRGLALMKSGGAVLNVSSVHATTTILNFSVYAASKGGMEALTRGLAVDLASMGIRVNAIRPGLIEVERELLDRSDPLFEMICERIPVRRPGCVDDIVPTAIHLCSDDSSFITGQVIPIDGGHQVVLNTPYAKGFAVNGAIKD